MVLALIFRFLIYFQLITVYNVRKGSNFIPSHVDRYQLDPALIAKKNLFFSTDLSWYPHKKIN